MKKSLRTLTMSYAVLQPAGYCVCEYVHIDEVSCHLSAVTLNKQNL
jgi:hypothetical protein